MKRIYYTTQRRLGYRSFSRIEGDDVIELKRMLHAAGLLAAVAHRVPERAGVDQHRRPAGAAAAAIRRQFEKRTAEAPRRHRGLQADYARFDDETIAAVDKFRDRQGPQLPGQPAGPRRRAPGLGIAVRVPREQEAAPVTALGPIDTAPLFTPLHAELIGLLRSLKDNEWLRPTIAPGWRVRDVAAHLLDGDLRHVAAYRDAHFVPLEAPITSAADLSRLVNRLNATGVAYAARLSSRQLVELLELSGGWVIELVNGLPLHGKAIWPVSWAGEERVRELDGRRS